MTDNPQRSEAETAPLPESASALSRASATVGIISAAFWFVPLIGRLAMYGFPAGINPSPLMGIGLFLALIGLITGIIASLRKGKGRLARVAIYTSGAVILAALLPVF
jgi:hypothetical protein